MSFWGKPTFRPDELAFGAVARFMRDGGRVFGRELLTFALGYTPQRVVAGWFARLDVLAQHCYGRPSSTVAFAQAHTLLPYYSALARGQSARALRHALAHSGAVDRSWSVLATTDQARPHFLRLCPECAAADRACFGESVWRRVHQLPGMSRCVHDGSPLFDSEVPVSGGVRQLLTPWPPRCPQEKSRRVKALWPRSVEEIVARRSSGLLSKPIGTSAHLGVGGYRRWLKSEGSRQRWGTLLRRASKTACSRFLAASSRGRGPHFKTSAGE